MPNYVSNHTGAQIENLLDKVDCLSYGECTTAQSTLAKVVTVDNERYSLISGVPVTIKFINDVPANSTLNINNTGAKSIFYKGAALIDGIIQANQIVSFVYDGTNYNVTTSGGANVNIQGASISNLNINVADTVLSIS